MEPGAMVMTLILGGAFFIGIWAIFLRKGASVNVSQGMSAEGLRNANNTPGFGRAKMNSTANLLWSKSVAEDVKQ